jgi:hypothetical protein
MSDTVRPGDRVRVVFPPKHVCTHHGMVNTRGQVGQVDRYDDRFGDHPIIVVFNTLRHPPFNDPWVEGFSPVELEVVPEPPSRSPPCDRHHTGPMWPRAILAPSRSRAVGPWW